MVSQYCNEVTVRPYIIVRDHVAHSTGPESSLRPVFNLAGIGEGEFRFHAFLGAFAKLPKKRLLASSCLSVYLRRRLLRGRTPLPLIRFL